MIIVVDIIIFMLSYIGSITVNIEHILFTHFSSITTIISQYLIPLILFFGYLINVKKRSAKVVKNENIKNHI